MGYIYLITNKINGKKYVGQTLCNDINDRWKQHRSKKSIGRCLKAAYIKYGIENFKFQIICICFDEDSNKLEIEYIKKYNTISPNGYNLSSGGGNKMTHHDTKKLISEKLKGRKLPKEQVEQMRQRMIGDKNPNYGKDMSEEIKQKLRGKALLRGTIILNEEQKERRNKGLLIGVEKSKKKVGQYDINNKLIAEFNSIIEASNKTNISFRSIGRVCNNVKYYKTAGGFIWKFV